MRNLAMAIGNRRPRRLRTAATATRRLPDRYYDAWQDEFFARVEPSLVPGVMILDVGSGRRPTIDPARRPPGCHYVGLDVSRVELECAPTGSYDEVLVGDVIRRLPELEGRFDLIVTWQVLEHVKPLDAAMENLRAYLRPGGRMVAQYSGALSVLGLLSKLVPRRLSSWSMQRLLGRSPDTIFPTYYDQCWYDATERILRPWSEVEIVPRYGGAVYFSFSRRLQRAYLAYEEWTRRSGRRNLASHYLVSAKR